MDDNCDDSLAGLPADIENAAKMAMDELIPFKSKERYNFAFNGYIKLCAEMGTEDITNEKVLLAYYYYCHLQQLHLEVKDK